MLRRVLLIAIVLVLALGVAAPFIKADRYGEQIEQALERGLKRKVDIGKVTFNLFTGPGFTVSDVVIHDDPTFGLEPLAHMLALDARVSLTSLLTGQLEFATLRFESPSVNLVKQESGTWNLVRLMQDAKTSTGSVPQLQVSDGRIFLKTGLTKSAFYIAEADVTISPGRDGLGIRFSGEPARTDRSSRSVGLITARGALTGGNLDLDIELDKSPVDELGGLLRGRRLEYHGSLSSRAKITGPLSKLAVRGSVNLSDVHRWDMMTDHNQSWAVNYGGSVDLDRARVDLATVNSPNQVRLMLTDVMTRPQWALDVAVKELPASTLVTIARDLGAPMPQAVGVEGKVVGSLVFGSLNGLEGELHVSEGVVKLQDGPELKLADAALLIEGDTFRLAPTALVGSEGQGAQLEGEYNATTQTLDATVSGNGLRLLSRGTVPLVARFQGGRWSAALRYRQVASDPGVWTGSFDVRDTATRVPGIAAPFRIATARIEIDGDALKVREMRAAAGDVELYGSYSYQPESARPHRFNVVIPTANIADLEQLLTPALRRDEGFFARTLRLRRAALPDWLQHRNAEGDVRIGSLEAGAVEFRAVRSHVTWDRGIVHLANLQARVEDGTIKGVASVDISKSEPQYKFRGRAQNVAWKGGKVDVEGAVETLGSGLELLLSLKGEGAFEARGVAVSADQVIRTARGNFQLSVARTGPQVRLSDVEASLGAEHFTGDGSTQPDGRLLMELASAGRTMRLNMDMAAAR